MEPGQFLFVPHTADIAVVVRGGGPADLMRNAAAALYAAAGVSSTATADCTHTIALDSVDLDTLLIDWLNELVFLLYSEHLAFAEFDFSRLSGVELVATCFGRRLTQGAGEPQREIKAATYHMAHVETEAGVLRAFVIFDV